VGTNFTTISWGWGGVLLTRGVGIAERAPPTHPQRGPRVDGGRGYARTYTTRIPRERVFREGRERCFYVCGFQDTKSLFTHIQHRAKESVLLACEIHACPCAQGICSRTETLAKRKIRNSWARTYVRACVRPPTFGRRVRKSGTSEMNSAAVFGRRTPPERANKKGATKPIPEGGREGPSAEARAYVRSDALRASTHGTYARLRTYRQLTRGPALPSRD
jgi:hypothetical protein